MIFSSRQVPTRARVGGGRRGPPRAGAYAHTAEQQRESPLIGTPDEIVAKLQTLRAAGVEYVMLNPAGSGANLRRFAREVMPHVAAQPGRVAAAG
jgi:alkanesulfonate monooxygenase SsuD/methylene tetrahydromethanopterin reductase-like flavin-dependent oxidoreductase (luciferase family)